MAKKSRNAERRAIIERMRREQERKERLRTWGVLAVCLVIVAGLGTVAVREYLKTRPQSLPALADLGVGRASAGCRPIKTADASGSSQHIPASTATPYPDAPPAYGRHWSNFLQGSEIKSFYTRKDAPPIQRLVHSLEHGYTILWYDDDVSTSSKDYQALVDIARRLSDSGHFMVAPYLTKDDGGTFPKGTDVALTHWTGPDNQTGVWEYCSGVSGSVVKDFVKKYPATNAPEPGAV